VQIEIEDLAPAPRHAKRDTIHAGQQLIQCGVNLEDHPRPARGEQRRIAGKLDGVA